MADPMATGTWPQLPLDAWDRITSYLRPNEVPCSVRLVNKASAADFRAPHHTTIRLSEPVPPRTFALQWSSPLAWKRLSLHRRRRLLTLTAASGVIPNLELGAAASGVPLTEEVALAAAAAGQERAYQWLRNRGCPSLLRGPPKYVVAAARQGSSTGCRYLLRDLRCGWSWEAVAAALRSGHAALADWLLTVPYNRRPQRSGAAAAAAGPAAAAARPAVLSQWSAGFLLTAAAEGCDLATLQRLWIGWLGSGGAAGSSTACATGGSREQRPAQQRPAEQRPAQQRPAQQRAQQLSRRQRARILAAAAGSPTPDWAAKVEWLAEAQQGCPLTALTARRAAAASAAAFAAANATHGAAAVMGPNGPSAVGRVVWLRQRGCPAVASDAVLAAAVRAGDAPAVQHLLRLHDAQGPTARRSFRCRVFLRWSYAEAACVAAARCGHLSVLQLLLPHATSSCGGAASGDSGNVIGATDDAVVNASWDDVGAYLSQKELLLAAARGGHTNVVAWLMEALRGGGAEEVLLDGRVFTAAAAAGSVELMAWLRERGVPWGTGAFAAAAGAGCEEVLEWLAVQGCPIEVIDLVAGSGSPYLAACCNGDLATLRCLRRLGVPWGCGGDRPSFGALFAAALHSPAPLPALRWLLDAGCPVAWSAGAATTGNTAALPSGSTRGMLLRGEQVDGEWGAASASWAGGSGEGRRGGPARHGACWRERLRQVLAWLEQMESEGRLGLRRYVQPLALEPQ